MTDSALRTLRDDADRILRSAIAAAAPGPLVGAALRTEPLDGSVHVLAVGKAALPMMHAALDALGHATRAALAVTPSLDPATARADPLHVLRGDHPVPGEASLLAAEAVSAFLEPLGQQDTLLVLLSGGTSALITQPAPGLTLGEVAHVTRALLAAGADIAMLNCVRKHLDRVKGGRLARLAAPAAVRCLALSDVIGDDPAIIGSGPFTADPSTFADARAVLERLDLWLRVPPAVRAHLEKATDESLKPGDPALARVRYQVIGGNRTAVAAAAGFAREAGYRVVVAEEPVMGEAREVGGRLGARAWAGDARTAWIAGGETTVTVRGAGAGGRSQELALAAAVALAGSGGVVLGAVGTDGVDGASPAAGAIVDGTTIERMRALGIDPQRALALNDSYPALAAIGDAVITGPTGTNVMDLVLVLTA